MYMAAGGGTAPQQVHHSTTIKKKPSGGGGGGGYSAPAPYSPPPAPPVYSNSSGQYSGGGGSPVSAPSSSMGAFNGVGNPGPSAEERRQQRLEARQERIRERRQERREHRQEVRKQRKEYREKKHDFRNFLKNDSTYQDQLSSLQHELGNYLVSSKDQRKRVGADFNLAQRRMGQERGTALEDMKNDFAARGLLNSTEFANALGDYDKQYNNQLGDLATDRQRNISDLLEALGLYRNQNRNERQSARQEAIRRRTQAFGGFDPTEGFQFQE